jgi:hypothetical protein
MFQVEMSNIKLNKLNPYKKRAYKFQIRFLVVELNIFHFPICILLMMAAYLSMILLLL